MVCLSIAVLFCLHQECEVQQKVGYKAFRQFVDEQLPKTGTQLQRSARWLEDEFARNNPSFWVFANSSRMKEINKLLKENGELRIELEINAGHGCVPDTYSREIGDNTKFEFSARQWHYWKKFHDPDRVDFNVIYLDDCKGFFSLKISGIDATSRSSLACWTFSKDFTWVEEK